MMRGLPILEATAKTGVVTLKGMTIVAENVDLSDQAARKVPGVEEVVNEIHYTPMTHAGQIHLK
jgi:osmotically-inducible protein OsmY